MLRVWSRSPSSLLSLAPYCPLRVPKGRRTGRFRSGFGPKPSPASATKKKPKNRLRGWPALADASSKKKYNPRGVWSHSPSPASALGFGSVAPPPLPRKVWNRSPSPAYANPPSAGQARNNKNKHISKKCTQQNTHEQVINISHHTHPAPARDLHSGAWTLGHLSGVVPTIAYIRL